MTKVDTCQKGGELPLAHEDVERENHVVSEIGCMSAGRCQNYVYLVKAIVHDLAKTDAPLLDDRGFETLQCCLDNLEDELRYLQDIMGCTCS